MDVPESVSGRTHEDSGLSSDKVVVCPYPKVVFFWPTWLVSVFCLLLPAGNETAGQLWMTVFMLNLLVVVYDFDESRSLIIFFAFASIVMAGLWLNVLGSALDLAGSIKPTMNRTFYGCLAGAFTAFFVFVKVRSYFDYWEFGPREVVHVSGLFQRMKRYPTSSMRWQKEIPDVLERILFSSGRIVMTTPHESHPIMIEHVWGINGKDDEIRRLLSSTLVMNESASDSD